MKSKLCRLRGLLIGLVGATIFAGCANFSAARPNPTEQMMLATYPLFSDKIIGTCFLVAVRDTRLGNRYFPVVVTSTHMLKAVGKDPLYIPLRMIDSDGKLSLALVRAGVGKGWPIFYVSHPSLDVAAFPLLLPESMEGNFALKLLEAKNFSYGGFRAGQDVSFVGYPEGLPGTPELFPVLRSARVASFDPGLAAERRFLVNGDVYPGDSGAPVFIASGKGPIKVGGMVVQRVEVSEGERSPIALAVDAGAIRETLDLLVGKLGLRGNEWENRDAK